jgi:hypothetical protein
VNKTMAWIDTRLILLHLEVQNGKYVFQEVMGAKIDY